jgi:hypothetical protein
MKYNLSKLMRKAWSLYRAAAKKAANTAKVEATAEALGVEEEYHTWAGWKALGRMVCHTEEAAFKVEVADPTTKKGTRVMSYFTYTQTQHLPA